VLLEKLGHAIVATLPAPILSATLNSRFIDRQPAVNTTKFYE